MSIDVLAIVAHPDDAELGCGGTLLAASALGLSTGIVDLTRGELGTRGTPEIRAAEAATADHILKLTLRENLGLRDGFFANDEASQRAIITAIRTHQPQLVITNAPADRHPDHGRSHSTVLQACFLSGLRRIETLGPDGQMQAPHRPARVIAMIQDRHLTPSLVVDISPHWDQKLAAIKAFKSQFFDPDSGEPVTHIAQPTYLDFLRSRARILGHMIGVEYGEGFILDEPTPVRDLRQLL